MAIDYEYMCNYIIMAINSLLDTSPFEEIAFHVIFEVSYKLC